MIEPVKSEYLVGKDLHSRTVRAIRKRTNGRTEWQLVSEPINQRDEGERMFSLTTENLIALGEIAKAKP